MQGPTLLLRPTSGPKTGSGHFLRSLALAQAWRNSGRQAVIATAAPGDILAARASASGIPLHALVSAAASPQEADELVLLASRFERPWIVLDGYECRAPLRENLRNAGLRILLIDDFGLSGPGPADLVLDQNVGSAEADYPWARTLLLGPDFALLRQEFSRPTTPRKPTDRPSVVLSFGGADPPDFTRRALDEMAPMADQVEITVVVGPQNPRAAALRAQAAAASQAIRVVQDPANLADLFAGADVVVGSASSTVLELLALGVPFAAIAIADNQNRVAQAIEREGFGVNLGTLEDYRPGALRRAVVSLLQAPARGRGTRLGTDGAYRVVTALLAHDLKVRPATAQDSHLYWLWRNDPKARAASFSPEAIPWADHESWFAQRLQDASSHYYILQDIRAAPVGYARFDREAQETHISVALDPERRGQGLGGAVIRCATQHFLSHPESGPVTAWVKSGNLASVRAFSNAGYHQAEASYIGRVPAIRLVATANDFHGARIARPA